MTTDVSMQKASECVTLPPTATSPRAMNMNKGEGKAKKPRVLVTDAQVDQFSCKSMGVGLGGGRSCMIMVLSWISLV